MFRQRNGMRKSTDIVAYSMFGECYGAVAKEAPDGRGGTRGGWARLVVRHPTSCPLLLEGVRAWPELTPSLEGLVTGVRR